MPLRWSQIYDPLNAWPLSTAMAALPVVTLFFVLVVLRQRVWVSALAGMLVAIATALLIFGMPSALIGNAALLGVVFGMTRVAWIIVASMFLYSIAVETGQFEVMKHSIASLSADRRLQAVLIAFCFWAFLEGTGGGGAPVAIAGAFLIGLGFPPFQAAVLCLLANTAPVAWGAVGNPIRVLAAVTALPEAQLSAMTGRILPPFSLILPIWQAGAMTAWRGAGSAACPGRRRRVVRHACYGSTTWRPDWSTLSPRFLTLVVVVLLKFWRPAISRRSPERCRVGPGTSIRPSGHQTGPLHSVVGVHLPVRALAVSASEIRAADFPLAGLHNRVLKMAPVTPVPTPESAMSITISWRCWDGGLPQGLIAGALFGLPIRRMLTLLSDGAPTGAVAAGDQLHAVGLASSRVPGWMR
jgi:L-lactate permease